MRTARGTIILMIASGLAAVAAGAADTPALRHLDAADATVRADSAAELGRQGDPAAVQALVGALDDSDADVRREAAKALGALKDARATDALVQALSDEDRNVRFYAAYALGEVRDPKAANALVRALGDPAYGVRDQAAWALRELGNPALAGPVVAALKQGKADAAHVLWLLRFLGGERGVEHLAALVDASDVEVRRKAVAALAKVGSEVCVESLTRALEDESPQVRGAAVEALAGIGDEGSLKALAALATRESDPAIRKAAADAAFRLSMHQDLVAWWSFDDRSADTAKDMTRRGADGEVKGCKVVEGKIGHALDFGGKAYIELGKPKSVKVGGTPLTLMAWIKPRAKTGVVVGRGGAFCGLSLYLKDGLPKFGIHREQEGPTYIAAGKRPVGDGWTHLAGVIHEDRVEVYVDGERVGTTKSKGYLPGECGQPMEIGFDTGNTAAEITDLFDGVIDEVKVYNAALSGEAIAEEACDRQSY